MPQSIRHKAAEGVAFLVLQSVASRVIILASQIVLGHALSPTAFGISGVALMIINIAWTMIGFGVDAVYIQRNARMPFWEKSAFFVTLGQGVVAGLLLLIAAPICAYAFKIPEMLPVLALVGLSMPIVSISVVPGAKINAALKFKWSATYNTIEQIATQSLLMIFAVTGLGSYAFFLPIPIIFTIRAIVYFWKAPVNFNGPMRLSQSWILLRKGGVIFLSRLLLVLIDQGDYLVLGLFASSQVVGFYFFAFRLAAMPVRIIAHTLQGVLFSVLSKFKGDPSRQVSASLRSAEILSYILSPICIIQISLSPNIFHLLFGDKWNGSILIFQILSVGLPAEAIASVARAHLNATGEFRRSLVYNGMNAAIFFIMVSVGAVMDKAIGVAFAVSAFYVIAQTILFFRVFPPGTDFLIHTARIFIWPLTYSAIATIVGYALATYAIHSASDIFQTTVISIVAGSIFVGLVWYCQRRVFEQILSLAAGAIGKSVK